MRSSLGCIRRPFFVLFLMAASCGAAAADPSAPDGGFGTAGVVIENLGAVEAGGKVLQLSTGKLLLTGGGSGGAAGHSFTRYDTNGMVDSGYGTVGTAAGHGGSLLGVTLLPGDALLVASDFDTGNLSHLNDAAVARYTAAGAKDGSFGTEGRVTFRFDPDTAADEHATDVIVLESGKLLVGGYLWRGGNNFDVAVVRLDEEGNLDTTFADDGYFTFDFKGDLDKAWQVLELPDNKILVYGEAADATAPGQPSKVLLLRLTSEGDIDETFGGAGTGYTTILTDVNSDLPGTMVRLDDGKFLFAVNGTAMWTAARVDENGILDDEFGTGGVVDLPAEFPGLLFPAAQSVGLALQGDGRFVVGGWVAAVTPQFQLKYDVGLARFEADGTPDTTFHSGSAQRLYTITDAAPETAANVLVQADGKIVLGGSYPNGADDRFMLRVDGDEPITTTTTSSSTTTSTTMPDACGDANGDGKINSSDALATLRAAVGVTTCPLSVCDADGDGKLRAADALRVLKYAVGADVELNCAG